jgi:HD superfamily phosphohydrolase
MYESEVQLRLSKSYYFPDPIQGTIELPLWLVSLKDEPAVRRMLFIRQLGLKAYIDFPGAIHTRYSHALGTMHLSGRMAEMLSEKMAKKGKHDIAKNLKDNLNNIMAAGFLHDIAHAPFSHAADFVVKKITGKSHEELCEDIIKEKIPQEIEDWGITKNSIIQLIKTKGHHNPFLSQIINGPLDSDKLDYLLRDAYHVGLKYSFDLDHFLRSYTVIGEEGNLSTCLLGLDSTRQGIVTAELFIVIWKSMYDLVYLVEQSRIAEKMLEKAFLLCENESSVKEMFKIDNFVNGNDENMLSQLEKMGKDVAQLLAPENPRRLYSVEMDKELTEKNFKMTAEFLAKVEDAPDALADNLSLLLAEELKLQKYSIICDVVKSKAPREIYLESDEKSEEEMLLRNRSDIVGVIKAKNALKVYVAPTILRNINSKHIQEALKNLVEGEVEGD